MALPILQVRSEPSPSDLIRLFHKTELALAQELGEEEPLASGVAFSNPDLPQVPGANHVREVALHAGVTPAQAVEEVTRHFESRGTRCGYWSINPSAPEEQVRPLVEHLLATGHAADAVDVMNLRRMPQGTVREVGGMTIIPARASYRHVRELAEEVAGELGGDGAGQQVEAHLLRLDDPHFEGILALKDGRAVGRVSVLTVGEVGRIEYVYVSRDYRRQGIGRTLMSRAVEACARSLFKHVFLCVAHDNAAAVALYKRFGFQKVGERVVYYTPGR